MDWIQVGNGINGFPDKCDDMVLLNTSDVSVKVVYETILKDPAADSHSHHGTKASPQPQSSRCDSLILLLTGCENGYHEGGKRKPLT